MKYSAKFLDACNALFTSKGFVREDSLQFSFRTATVEKVLSFDIDERRGRASITPQLLVRHSEISRVRKGFTALKHKGAYYWTVIKVQYSVAEDYGREEYKIFRHIVEDEGSLHGSINNFSEFMEELGFPFLNQFQVLADFDRFFSSPIFNGTYDFKRGNILNFSVEGLVAAKLNGNPRYEELYEIWMKSISPDFTEALTILEALKKYLDSGDYKQ